MKILFKNIIRFISLFVFFMLSNNLFLFATNIIIPVIPDGPGTVEQKIIDKITDVKESSTLPIASDSDIFIHDNIYYVKGESKGKFSLSGYCACKKCGTGTGITASGHKVREGHTIASDWKVLPKGTMIILENAVGKDGSIYDGVYEVEDRGGGVKNNHLDIYRPTHDLACLVTAKGRCYGDVYIAIPIGNVE